MPFTYTFQEAINIKNPAKQQTNQFIPLVSHLTKNSLLQDKIIKISCGSYHSLFLTENHQIMSCGCYLNGRLGLGRALIQNVSQPTLISSLAGKTIIDVIS